MPNIKLAGCHFDTILGYLKTLGIMRVIDQQFSDTCGIPQGKWENGIFQLNLKTNKKKLFELFYKDYEPSPILVPWSGGSIIKLQKKTQKKKNKFNKNSKPSNYLDKIYLSSNSRIKQARCVLNNIFQIFQQLQIKNKKQRDKEKHKFVSKLRIQSIDTFVDWIDTCAVLNSEKPVFAPLMGSGGGSDGRANFAKSFYDNLEEVIPVFNQWNKKSTLKNHQQKSKAWFEEALFNTPHKFGRLNYSPALFESGTRGAGPNISQDAKERNSLLNPWDFVLGLEGAFIFAGSLFRRFESSTNHTSFPFQTDLSSGGDDTSLNIESGNQAKELWLPLWENFVDYEELKLLFKEGRSSLGSKQAQNGLDFLKAVKNLGIDRGVSGFNRFGISKGRVGGNNYNSSFFLGNFKTGFDKNIKLLSEIDSFVSQLRYKSMDKDTPTRFKIVFNKIENSIFSYLKSGDKIYFRELFLELGKAEYTITRGGINKKIPLVPPIDQKWAQKSWDGSAEFYLALALSQIYDKTTGSISKNMEPVNRGRAWASWGNKEPKQVWTNSDIIENMFFVLSRRMLDCSRKDNSFKVPVSSSFNAPLNLVSQFLHRNIDLKKLELYLWSCILLKKVNPGYFTDKYNQNQYILPIPRIYLLLKTLFLPYDLEIKGQKYKITPEPAILNHLKAGNLEKAWKIANHRLRVSGLVPKPGIFHGKNRDQIWANTQNIDGKLLGAALLIPISKYEVENNFVNILFKTS
ncbi:MAG: type I-U CRISPR-associated protein Csx17 [Deltaproteobacteria bacterium]|jgi:CRISPR-associated protein Csx17|nr:type I-U CRISPR-associated protein Csx17 [Deltaproteobacteria bacterium]